MYYIGIIGRFAENKIFYLQARYQNIFFET